MDQNDSKPMIVFEFCRIFLLRKKWRLISFKSFKLGIFYYSLLGCILAFLDVKSTILGKAHYILYALSTAIQPRMLVTFDEVMN